MTIQFLVGFVLGVAAGATGLVLALHRTYRDKRKPTDRQREVFLALRRELDATALLARDLKDEVLVHRIAVLRAPSLDSILFRENLAQYHVDVSNTLSASARYATPERNDMLLALDRADDHAKTLLLTTRPYQQELPAGKN